MIFMKLLLSIISHFSLAYVILLLFTSPNFSPFIFYYYYLSGARKLINIDRMLVMAEKGVKSMHITSL